MSMSTEINADGDCRTAVDVMELLMGFQKSQVITFSLQLCAKQEILRAVSEAWSQWRCKNPLVAKNKKPIYTRSECKTELLN